MTEMATNWKSTSPIPYNYFTSKMIYSIVYLKRIRLPQGPLCYYPNLICFPVPGMDFVDLIVFCRVDSAPYFSTNELLVINLALEGSAGRLMI